MLAITNSIERRAVRQIFMWLPNYTFWVECVECLRLTEETNALATKNMWWRRRWRRWWWWWWAPITKPPRNSKRDKANEKICLTIVCHLIHRSFLSGHQLCVLCVCVAVDWAQRPHAFRIRIFRGRRRCKQQRKLSLSRIHKSTYVVRTYTDTLIPVSSTSARIECTSRREQTQNRRKQKRISNQRKSCGRSIVIALGYIICVCAREREKPLAGCLCDVRVRSTLVCTIHLVINQL